MKKQKNKNKTKQTKTYQAILREENQTTRKKVDICDFQPHVENGWSWSKTDNNGL